MKEFNFENPSKRELEEVFAIERSRKSEVSDYISFITKILNDPEPKLTPNEILDEIMWIDSDELDERMSGKRKLVDLCISKGAKIEDSITVYHTKFHAYSLLTCQECADGKAVYMYTGMYPKKYNSKEIGLIDYAYAISHVAGLGLTASINPVAGFGGLLVPLAEPITELVSGRGLISAAGKLISQYQKQTYEIRREFAFDLIPSDELHSKIAERDIDRDREHLKPGYRKLVKKKIYKISPEDAKKAYEFIESAITGKVQGLNYRFMGSNCADYTQKILESGGFMDNHLYEFYGFSPSAPSGRIHAYHMAKAVSNIFLAPYYFAEDVGHKFTKLLELKDETTSQAHSFNKGGNISYDALLNSDKMQDHRPPALTSLGQGRGHTGIGKSNIYDDATSVTLLMFVIGSLVHYSCKTLKSYFKDGAKKEVKSQDVKQR